MKNSRSSSMRKDFIAYTEYWKIACDSHCRCCKVCSRFERPISPLILVSPIFRIEIDRDFPMLQRRSSVKQTVDCIVVGAWRILGCCRWEKNLIHERPTANYRVNFVIDAATSLLDSIVDTNILRRKKISEIEDKDENHICNTIGYHLNFSINVSFTFPDFLLIDHSHRSQNPKCCNDDKLQKS